MFLILALVVLGVSGVEVKRPIKFAYVNSINSWSSSSSVLAGMGVPGYGPETDYNYIALTFWSPQGPLDMVKAWD